MIPYSYQKIVTNVAIPSCVYDSVSNSVWAVTAGASGSWIRIRATDGAYLNAGGVVTNLAGATFSAGTSFAGASGIAGRKLYVGSQSTLVRRFSADTGAFEYEYPTPYYPTSGWNAVTVNGVCWFCVAVNGGSVADGIQGFDAAGNTSFWSGGGSGASPTYLATDGTFIYFVSTSSGPRTVWKIDPADGTVTSAVVMSASYSASQIVSVSCDGTHLWLGTGIDAYIWKVRCSDLAPIDTNGNVCTAASNGNRFALRSAPVIATTAYASVHDGNAIWIAPGSLEFQFSIVDRLTGYNDAHIWIPGVTSSSSKNPILVNSYVWFPIDNVGDIWRVSLLP